MKKQFVQNDNNMAVAYYRFSSHAQNEQSIDQQRELAEEYAQIHGLNIVKEYADEALSGRDDTRPQYQLLLSEIKTLKPAVLILWKTDRLVLPLTYSPRDALTRIEERIFFEISRV